MASKKLTKTKNIIKNKPVAKKPAAKTAKPVKATAKKPVAKPVKKAAPKPAKKVTKPVAKVQPKAKAKPIAKSQKAVKSKAVAAPKKAKPVAKKKTVVKPVKKAAAPAKVKPVKKAAPKKVNKPVAKKKVVAKPVAKKPVPKTKTVAKNNKTKPTKVVKPVKKVTAPVKKVAAPKKPVAVAPAKKKEPVKNTPPVKASKEKEVAKKPAAVKPVAEKTEKKGQEKKAGEIREKVKSSRRSKKGKKGAGGDEDEPKMEGFDPLVEELIATTKKTKHPKAPKVKAPIKLMPTVKIEAAVKEHIIPKNFRFGDKEEFQMEFFVKSSPRILFNFISSPSGLSEWFANNVNIKNGEYTFFWEDSQEQAKLLFTREFEIMRFKWSNTETDDTYFELKIKVDELTGDVALIVTDFAKKEELQEAQLLWETQIHDLMKALGS